MALLTFILNRFNLYIKGHVIVYLMRNLKEHVLRHVIILLMDFYSNNSFGEVLAVIGLEKLYIYFVESLILNLIPSIINIITFIVYFLHFINIYVRLIIINIIVVYIWTKLIKNPKLF